MKDFEYHINVESQTIKEFDEATGSKVKIRKLMNQGFSSYDFIFTLNEKIIYFTEVKTRAVYKDQYLTTILEKKKVNNINLLIKEAELVKITDMEIRPGFLVKFIDGLYFFDLETAPYETSIKSCPKHSASGGNNNYVEKELLHYSLGDGKKIK